MHYEHEGMRLWIEPQGKLSGDGLPPGSDVALTVGVEPADASNRVQIQYRINGGPTRTIPAEPVRHVGNTQYFNAQLPGSGLRAGDTVEYTAVCQCAGRQVPSPPDAERFAFSFQMREGSGAGARAPALSRATSVQVSPPQPAPASGIAPSGRSAVAASDLLRPTHLSLFASARSTGHPIARMPFYAEVGVTAETRNPPIVDLRFAEPISAVLSPATGMTMMDLGAARYARLPGLPQSLLEILSSWLAPETRNQLAAEPATVEKIIRDILERFGQGKGNVDPNDPEAVRRLLEDAFRAYLANHPELALAPTRTIKWAHPLGVLATDHVGYLSFDLTRLPADVYNALLAALHARRVDPHATTDTSIWLYPMGREETRIDALAQGRFAHDAIVVRLELDAPGLPQELRNLGILAMQNPDLTDWRLSPASFAANPAALLGEDGCENLFPANVATQEFYFYQVVSLSDVEEPVPGTIKLGIVNEYRLAWYPLGHSLGQIQYTLPLAPGESVNLAVVDWTRRDVGKRTEDTKEAEQLIHNERRDRTITETVEAAIKEHQSGSSFMWGTAASGGAAGTAGLVGLAAGITGSLGGSSSDSYGSRDIAGNTVQKLSDNITQASAAMRELQSTVVVQTTSHEKEAIETRTVVNYNHSHALTILYYEVLRHFRVVTEFVRRRPVVLAKIDGLPPFPRKPSPPSGGDLQAASLYQAQLSQYFGMLNQTYTILLENRTTLEASLLDKGHADGFNALERIKHREAVATVVGPPPAPLGPPPEPGDQAFVFFRFEMLSGGWIADYEAHGEQRIEVTCNLKGFPKPIRNTSGASGFEVKTIYLQNPTKTEQSLAKGNQFRFPDTWNKFYASLSENTPSVRWGDIALVEIGVTPFECHASFKHIKITGIDAQGSAQDLVDENYDQGHLLFRQGTTFVLPVKPPPRPSSPPQPVRPAEEIEDEVKVNLFLEHLNHNAAHYRRALETV